MWRNHFNRKKRKSGYQHIAKICSKTFSTHETLTLHEL